LVMLTTLAAPSEAFKPFTIALNRLPPMFCLIALIAISAAGLDDFDEEFEDMILEGIFLGADI
jgi:hypothetical protein